MPPPKGSHLFFNLPILDSPIKIFLLRGNKTGMRAVI